MLEKVINRTVPKSIFLFFILFISLPQLNLRAQCAPGSLSRDCIKNIGEGFIYLKSFSVDGQAISGDKVEYTAVMSKDTQYAFNICTALEGADGIVLTIYDSNRNVILSNREGNVIDPELNYFCNSTGIYYVRFTFHDSKNRCGGCILSFKKFQD